MKNILLTGGAGFIGSNFINYFCRKYRDYNIINLDLLTYAGNLQNLVEAENFKNYHFIKGSITDHHLVREIFEKFEINSVINFAAESHVDRSILGSKVFIETNIMGTHTLLECAKEFGINKFLHVSTDEVYGSLGEEGSFNENSQIKPNSPYAASKAASDLIARSYFKTHKVSVIITRCSNNYGPFQFPEKLIPLVINNCLLKKTIPVYGTGENVRDWIYVLDHVEALDKVFHEGLMGEVYNIGSNNEWKNIDIIKLICSKLEKKLCFSRGKLEGLIDFVKDRPGHDLRYSIDSSKIKTKLKWQPQVPFELGLSKTIDWYLENKRWVESVTSGEYQNYYNLHYKDREKTFF